VAARGAIVRAPANSSKPKNRRIAILTSSSL
jgi:hypothetical protein